MYTWILVFLLCSWKIETLFLKRKDQKLHKVKQVETPCLVLMKTQYCSLNRSSPVEQLCITLLRIIVNVSTQAWGGERVLPFFCDYRVLRGKDLISRSNGPLGSNCFSSDVHTSISSKETYSHLWFPGGPDSCPPHPLIARMPGACRQL